MWEAVEPVARTLFSGQVGLLTREFLDSWFCDETRLLLVAYLATVQEKAIPAISLSKLAKNQLSIRRTGYN